MKVSELIERLKELPQDAVVVQYDSKKYLLFVDEAGLVNKNSELIKPLDPTGKREFVVIL